MSVSDLERELERWRGEPAAPSQAERVTVEQALAYRDSGNVPDERGRSLRLVLEVNDESDLGALGVKRLAYEPDYHEAPRWRREGSVPVNVVPLRAQDVKGPAASSWWEQPDLARLESEWSATGTVAGLHVPAEYRSFVYKTVLGLRGAGREITVQTLLDSLARWMPADEMQPLERALRAANPKT